MKPFKELYIGLKINPDNMAVMNMKPAEAIEFFKSNDEYDCETDAEAKGHYNCVFGVKPVCGHGVHPRQEGVKYSDVLGSLLQFSSGLQARHYHGHPRHSPQGAEGSLCKKALTQATQAPGGLQSWREVILSHPWRHRSGYRSYRSRWKWACCWRSRGNRRL
jgi:hypothetical protein